MEREGGRAKENKRRDCAGDANCTVCFLLAASLVVVVVVVLNGVSVSKECVCKSRMQSEKEHRPLSAGRREEKQIVSN